MKYFKIKIKEVRTDDNGKDKKVSYTVLLKEESVEQAAFVANKKLEGSSAEVESISDSKIEEVWDDEASATNY